MRDEVGHYDANDCQSLESYQPGSRLTSLTRGELGTVPTIQDCIVEPSQTLTSLQGKSLRGLVRKGDKN